jgi:hypothetical protein
MQILLCHSKHMKVMTQQDEERGRGTTKHQVFRHTEVTVVTPFTHSEQKLPYSPFRSNVCIQCNMMKLHYDCFEDSENFERGPGFDSLRYQIL